MVMVKEAKCVNLKHEIQMRLAKDFEGMSEDEIRIEQKRRIKENAVFGRLSEKWKVLNPDTNA